jgi:hypothetical protein
MRCAPLGCAVAARNMTTARPVSYGEQLVLLSCAHREPTRVGALHIPGEKLCLRTSNAEGYEGHVNNDSPFDHDDEEH